MRAKLSVRSSMRMRSNCFEIDSSALRSVGVFSMPTKSVPVRTCVSPNISEP